MDLELTFPWWLRLTHYANIIFMLFLMRSGIEIIATHPKLYWNDASKPGTEWARFTRKKMPKDKLWDALDEEESYSSIVSMPGHENLGMGRHWHFLNVIFWILTGVVYVALLFIDDQWRHLIPTSWSVFPEAWQDILAYLSFQLPEHQGTYNAVQKLAYGSVVFILAPFQIFTGAFQSPAVEARFPRLLRLLGGRQWVRSLHFFGLLAFIGFIIVHVGMVIVHGFGVEMTLMVYGRELPERATSAAIIGIIGILGVVAIHVAATKLTLRYPRRVQVYFGAVLNRARRLLFLQSVTSRQDYPEKTLSPQHRVNGKPPSDDSYKIMAAHNFADYKLEVGGLVERTMTFPLEDLRTFPTRQNQRVLHNCIQGWTSIGEWGGVPLRQIIELVKPLPEARYLVFWTMQDVGRDEPAKAELGGRFYETIDMELASHPQTILALEMNGKTLPIEHGAPLRLRVETQVGFKMAKWVDHIEFVADFSDIGEGQGGWREDNVYYDKDAGI